MVSAASSWKARIAFTRDLTVQLTGHDLLKSLGIALIPATAPDFFVEDTPTAVLVRQVLGAITQFETTGKCGGRRSYCEARPDVVALAKQLQARGMSLRKISATLAAQGHLTGGGKPSVASAVQAMLAA
jgi:hypothetical protein